MRYEYKNTPPSDVLSFLHIRRRSTDVTPDQLERNDRILRELSDH